MNLVEELIKSNKTLTDRLLEEVSDYDIYCEFSGIDFEIGRAVNSPLREDDTRASFSLFIPTKIKDPRPEELWWRDFAQGSGDVFKFVKKFAAFHYGEELITRTDVIKFIDEQLNLGLFTTTSNKTPRIKREIDWDKARESKEILFKSREFTRMDKFWWIKYGVDEQLLKDHNVRSVLYLLDEDFSIKYKFGAYELAFAYVVYDKVKIYCPTEDTFKWRNTCPSDYILGAEYCTRNDVLIITKSMKDILVFKSLMECDAIAPQAEGLHISEDLINKIKARYRDVYVVMDYDDTGIEAATRLEDYGFTVRWVSKEKVLINGKLKVKTKDISDYVEEKGIQAGLNRAKEMFPELSPSKFRDDRVKHLLLLQKELSS